MKGRMARGGARADGLPVRTLERALVEYQSSKCQRCIDGENKNLIQLAEAPSDLRVRAKNDGAGEIVLPFPST